MTTALTCETYHQSYAIAKLAPSCATRAPSKCTCVKSIGQRTRLAASSQMKPTSKLPTVDWPKSKVSGTAPRALRNYFKRPITMNKVM